MSNQTFDVIIEIKEASHLDENRTFIRNVYNETKEKDNITVSMPDKEFLRVRFEQNLTNEKDITIYAQSNDTNNPVDVEVYEKDQNTSQEPLAVFENISDYKKYRILLTDMEENHSQDVFDLMTVSGNENISVSYDYVVDPPTNASIVLEPLYPLNDIKVIKNNIFNVQFKSSKNLFILSIIISKLKLFSITFIPFFV